MTATYCASKHSNWLLTLRQEYINQPFSMVSENIETKRDLLIRDIVGMFFPVRDKALHWIKQTKQWGPCNYNTPHRRKEKQVAARFCDDDLIISMRELCNHGDVFPLGKSAE